MILMYPKLALHQRAYISTSSSLYKFHEMRLVKRKDLYYNKVHGQESVGSIFLPPSQKLTFGGQSWNNKK